MKTLDEAKTAIDNLIEELNVSPLSDDDFCEALEYVIDKADSALAAKREEMERDEAEHGN